LFENSGVELAVENSSLTEVKEASANLENIFEKLEVDEEVNDSSGVFRERKKLKGSRRR
jgi:hypothetical protein